MALFDRSGLQEIASKYLRCHELTYKASFYSEAFAYARYLANSAVLPYKKFWIKRLGMNPALDASMCAIEKLVGYVEGLGFPQSTWVENPMGCLTQFLKQRIISFFRSELKHVRHIDQVDLDNHSSQVAGDFDELENSVYAIAFKDMKIQAVTEALAKVPDDLRNVYELRYGENLSPREIAKKQGVPVSKIYGRVAQLKLSVKKNLSCNVLSA